MSNRLLSLALGAALACSGTALLLVSLQPSAPAPDAAPLHRFQPGDLPLPVPILGRDIDDKIDHKMRRKRWFADLHRAPPGVDWKAIERENGIALQARRNAMAGARGASESQWREKGSENQAGRSHVARRSLDGQTLYVGSSLGGVWKGSLDGEDWTPIGDNLYGGAHNMVILNPDEESGPDVVLVATNSGLVHRTSDDGITWEEPAGLPSLTGAKRLS